MTIVSRSDLKRLAECILSFHDRLTSLPKHLITILLVDLFRSVTPIQATKAPHGVPPHVAPESTGSFLRTGLYQVLGVLDHSPTVVASVSQCVRVWKPACLETGVSGYTRCDTQWSLVKAAQGGGKKLKDHDILIDCCDPYQARRYKAMHAWTWAT